MKFYFIPILTLFILNGSAAGAQSTGDVLNIALKGDANTEQSAKLELIRILQERLNKLTVAQLNSRILVSTGVKNYYKVAEIFKMHDQMWGFRAQLTTESQALATANPGFGEAGNNFIWKYQMQFNEAMSTAGVIKNQTKVLITDGKPIALPPMPTFSISPPASVDDMANSFVGTMNSIMSQYGIKSQEDIDKLPADQKAAFQAAVDAAKADFEKALKASASATTKSSLTLLGNVIGTLVGVPGAGSIIAGLASGDKGAISGLVGSIVDRFDIPDEYFDSETLKLTDAERIKMIDELHSRMSEMFQKGIALRANMNAEVKKRYDTISQPRNEQILYGPKK
ncbi:hypothetical protein GO755_27965 [Spirosoma sp. HMF4905]|uniref:Uncharacterized protein n=1 Tax=Spirosoma arboris TaxID=2682092 RepID=A0A7K1SJF4_9BACT|nr:hypothetical protein [Spirosoma arboris]MVM33905.1 hypothetical protein [Spirosoma arboris]